MEKNNTNWGIKSGIEIINSDDFMILLDNILSRTQTFNKKYIKELFTKIRTGKHLKKIEIEHITLFINDSEVEKIWWELLKEINPDSLLWKFNSFNELIDDIFWSYKQEVKDILEIYEWMTKYKIILNWIEKEIYLDDENLKVDSNNWEKKTIWWILVKVNPEWDITEYLEWELAWEQLFTKKAAIREAKKLWKRLPYYRDNFSEFKGIISNIWIDKFINVLPWCKNWDSFLKVWENIYFWIDSEENLCLWIDICDFDYNIYDCDSNFLLSVRLVRD